MDTTAMVHIKLEGVQHQIRLVVMAHAQELAGKIDAAVENAMKTFDFGALVEKHVHAVLDDICREALADAISYAYRRDLAAKLYEATKEGLKP